MRRWLIAVAVLVVLAPAALWAQEEGLTLESVGESLAALVERISALETAVKTPDLLTGIPIRDEQRCTPYNASSYSYPDSLDLELLREMDGLYYSPYTDQLYADPREVDIEHIVARSEAHDSGLCAARPLHPPRLRQRLSQPHLRAALAQPRCQSRQGPGRIAARRKRVLVCQPRRHGETQIRSFDGCRRSRGRPPVAAVLRVGWPHPSRRHPHGRLPCRRSRLRRKLARPRPPAARRIPSPSTTTTANGKISCAEARNHNIAPVRRGQPTYEHMRDADGDGVVCE